ncbi:hypothetical protein Lser_V15G29642 [Lactuca serriola]
MEDLNILRIKKQMLLIELSAIEQKINLYEQVTTVTNVPESESSKTKAIAVQTAPGKESTNPLKADALLKSIIKETATPLPNGKTSLLVDPNPCTEGISKMKTLSPTNKSVQEFTPDYKKALNKEAERFDVIYKGPHAGVHTDQGIIETFCKVDKVTCKKFRNEASARLSLATYQDDTSKTNQPLIRPKIQKVKEAHRDQRTIWKKVRAACPEDLVHEKFFTTDKKTKSLFNFLEGADAKLVYQAFQAGLIDNIYPSCNLQELKFFPSSMVESIKNFRKKVLKAKDNPIYIRCISSLPEWIQESTLSPYHFLEVGLSKANREIEQSQPMEDKDLPFIEILHPNRINGLRRISDKIIDIISGSKKKINYTDSHCIITSWSYNNTSQEDLRQASKFGEKFMNNSMEVSNAIRQHFCRHAEQLFEEHLCHFCERKDSQTKEGPPSEDDKSSSS